MSALHSRGERGLHHLAALAAATSRPNDVAALACDLLADLDQCRGASVYRAGGRSPVLTLQAASGFPDPPLLVQGANLTGEGPVGLCAERREPVHQWVGAAYVSAFPLASRDGTLLGVVCLAWAGARLAPPSEPTLQTLLALLALALENLALGERHARRGELLGALSTIVSPPAGLDGWGETFMDLVHVAERAAGPGVWAIYCVDRPGQELRLVATSRRDAALPARWSDAPVEADALCSSGPHVLRWAGPREGTALCTPVLLDRQLVGMVVCLEEGAREFVPSDHETATCIASAVALTCRTRALAAAAASRDRPADVLWRLLMPAGTPAGTPDTRTTRAAAAAAAGAGAVAERRVVLVADAPDRAAAERLCQRIAEAERSALVDLAGPGTVTALVRPETPEAVAASDVSLGVSRACSRPGEYPDGLQQARQALELGTRLWGAGRLTRYDDLGSYRFMPALLQHGLAQDAEYGRVSALPEELLRTLDVYLDCGGNTAEAARRLYLHRNTLRQRLDRTCALLGIDLLTSSRWLSLHLATKAARLSLPTPAGLDTLVQAGSGGRICAEARRAPAALKRPAATGRAASQPPKLRAVSA